MSNLPTNLAETPAMPITMDLVHDIPRRVVGFCVDVETGMENDQLRRSLEEIANETAFYLAEMREINANRGEEGRLVQAEFALTATRGTVGDPQIFVLLRAIAQRHRWNRTDKILAR